MKNKFKSNVVVHSSFTAGKLTNFSGILPVFKFLHKIGLNTLLDQELSLKDKSNQTYSLKQILNAVILGVLSGADRMIKIEYFTLDPLVQKLLALSKQIDADTLRTHFKKFTMKHSTQLQLINAKLSGRIHKKLKTSSDILDLDSSVKTVYGKQEGAKKGFNSTHKGKRSYHPQLAFLNSTKECFLAWLRPGDTHSVNNASEFIKQALALLPSGIKHLMIRADRGYFDGKLLDVLEAYINFTYIIKVKLKNLESLLRKQEWESIPGMPKWEMTEFMYKAKSWTKERRFVAVRKFERMDYENSFFPTPHYSYFCYVTNIVDSPLQIHALYGDRAESENWIEHIKNQLFAGRILTQNFWTNEAVFLLSVMAYNMSVWMRKLTHHKAWRQEPLTFRSWFIQIAGKVLRRSRQTHLSMYQAYYHKKWWKEIDEKIDSLCLL